MGYQILGVIILQAGGFLPKIVENAILYSTTWEYDRRREWSEAFVEERKENLERFRNAVITYKNGQIIAIDF